MSGQWEVVGKKKGRDNSISNKKSATDNNKKNSVQSFPSIEDVLVPLHQVKNLFNKESRKPQEKEKKKTENVAKKVVKKPEEHHELPRPKHKTIESALNSINVNEFKNSFELNQRLFPDAPIVWLKQMVQFLNLRVPVDVQDCTFSTRPENYPLSAIPTALRASIENTVNDVEENKLKLFFDISLNAMTTDMSKNLSALGHKFYIQILALKYPHFAVADLNKFMTLRNSYQNRQSIGISIMWALGQAGTKNLEIGLTVFQEIFLPLIELKSYSKYVVQYLLDLIEKHKNGSINVQQYLLVLDVAFANYKNVPGNLKKDSIEVVTKLKPMLLSGYTQDKYHFIVGPLLKKLQSSNHDTYKNLICDLLIDCLSQDKAGFGCWTKCYSKNVPQSAILLEFMNDNWNELSGKFKKFTLKKVLKTFSDTNEELKANRKKEVGLVESEIIIEKLKEKMAKKSGNGFPHKTVLLGVFIIFLGIVYVDIKQCGSWKQSEAYKGLEKMGLTEHINKAIDKSYKGIEWIHLRIDEQIPGYYEKVSAHLKPYVKLSQDLSLVMYNIGGNMKEAAIAKYPVVRASIDSYAPGVIDKCHKTTVDLYATLSLYFKQGGDYLSTKFIPKVMETHDLILRKATQKVEDCYAWLSRKVQ